jgi:hypothetical protein
MASYQHSYEKSGRPSRESASACSSGCCGDWKVCNAARNLPQFGSSIQSVTKPRSAKATIAGRAAFEVIRRRAGLTPEARPFPRASQTLSDASCSEKAASARDLRDPVLHPPLAGVTRVEWLFAEVAFGDARALSSMMHLMEVRTHFRGPVDVALWLKRATPQPPNFLRTFAACVP